MTDENKTDALQKSEETQQDNATNLPEDKTDSGTESSEVVLELTDTNNYPNQRELMNHIVALYNQLNPSHKKLVRLTIARPFKE